jgi:hypothetical protein
LPTVTVPLLPVSLPEVPSIPIVTAVTTTTTAASPGATAPADTRESVPVAAPSSGSSTERVAAGTALAGLTRLASGAVSIPVSSVTVPARLVIGLVTIAPKWIGARGQRVRLVARITDTRGYRVRDASVDAYGTPAGRIKPAGVQTTRADGTVSLQLSTTLRMPLRAGSKLTIVIRASGAGSVVRRVVSLPIRPS